MGRKSSTKTRKDVKATPETEDKLNFDESNDEFDGFASTDEEDLELLSGEEPETEQIESGGSIKKDKAVSNDPESNTGVVYVGRIPHGFHELEMKRYFSQFGEITRLRLSRNKRTGASKHYAFIEFKSPDVADIVCDAMDNYLMFGHMLRVKRVKPAEMHPDIFKGANRRFDPVSVGERGIRRYRSRHPRTWWEEHTENDRKRRQERSRKLEALGIDYALP